MTNERQLVLMALGNELAAAWKSPGSIIESSAEYLPEDRQEACFVQDQMAYSIDQDCSGWTMRFNPANTVNSDDVIPGRIFSSVCWQGSNVSLPIERFPQALVTAGFAFRLTSTLPVRGVAWCSDELTTVTTVHPAIEITGLRHNLAELPLGDRNLMTIADNGGGLGVIFSDTEVSWHELDLRQQTVKLQLDNQPVVENSSVEYRPKPICALAALINHLQDRGIGLEAGDLVLSCWLTDPHSIDGITSVRADFDALGSILLNFE